MKIKSCYFRIRKCLEASADSVFPYYIYSKYTQLNREVKSSFRPTHAELIYIVSLGSSSQYCSIMETFVSKLENGFQSFAVYQPSLGLLLVASNVLLINDTWVPVKSIACIPTFMPETLYDTWKNASGSLVSQARHNQDCSRYHIGLDEICTAFDIK